MLIVAVRAALALVGGVAAYLLAYGGSGWLAQRLGYETLVGRVFGFINGALSPMAFAAIVIPIFVVAIFWLLHKFAFRRSSNANNAA